MARTPAPGDFTVPVDGLGNFTFGRRTPRDVFRIRGLYAQMTGGNYTEDGQYNDFPAFVFASLQVLMVDAPEGFDLNKLDPLADEQWEARLITIFAELRKKELSFRPVGGEAGQAPSA